MSKGYKQKKPLEIEVYLIYCQDAGAFTSNPVRSFQI